MFGPVRRVEGHAAERSASRAGAWPDRDAAATMARVTHVAIIGGGPGGYEAALVAAQLGADVTVVDSDGIGGSAVLTDCVPSKTLIATAEVMTQTEVAGELGITFGLEHDGTPDRTADAAVDLDKVNRRVLDLARAQSDDIQQRLERDGVEVVVGRGRLDGPQRVVAPHRRRRAHASTPTSCWSRPVPRRAPSTTRSRTASGSSPGSRSTSSRARPSTSSSWAPASPAPSSPAPTTRSASRSRW